MNIKTAKGAPVDAATAEQLRTLITTIGLDATARRLGCSPAALQRAACGLPVLRGTAALCRAGLFLRGAATAPAPNEVLGTTLLRRFVACCAHPRLAAFRGAL